MSPISKDTRFCWGKSWWFLRLHDGFLVIYCTVLILLLVLENVHKKKCCYHTVTKSKKEGQDHALLMSLSSSDVNILSTPLPIPHSLFYFLRLVKHFFPSWCSESLMGSLLLLNDLLLSNIIACTLRRCLKCFVSKISGDINKNKQLMDILLLVYF